MKILIVDDEPLVRKSLLRVLVSKGHMVLEAEDGARGLELWKTSKPDLVLIDVLMPGMTGPQVLQQIGSYRGKSKVVLMSAYSGEHNMQTAQQLGADMFIAKPFESIFEVARVLEDLVGR